VVTVANVCLSEVLKSSIPGPQGQSILAWWTAWPMKFRSPMAFLFFEIYFLKRRQKISFK